ncbi:hypothetical protein ACHAWF_006482 [Thalassiosira exigua]
MKFPDDAPFLLLLLSAGLLPAPTFGFSSARIAPGAGAVAGAAAPDVPDRPLLRAFGRGIGRRVRRSKEGADRRGRDGAYTSDETIPCLDMRGKDREVSEARELSSRGDIRRAFAESSRAPLRGRRGRGGGPRTTTSSTETSLPHGRSSGSGCAIVRLTGSDAASMRGLVSYADRFFERVDDDGCDGDGGGGRGDDVRDAGVFRIDDHVYAGFDGDVNGEGKMQFLDTRILPSEEGAVDPLLLPMEVGELVGSESLDAARRGMGTLLDVGTQITSAVLDMDGASADKLIDDGTRARRGRGDDEQRRGSEATAAGGDVSNSYHRLIRYLTPQPSGAGAAFQAHVDSSFLTLVPMPELPGLEVWCPSKGASDGGASDESDATAMGEWVRPTMPFDVSMEQESESKSNDCAYVIVMAGEFLQLTSNGDVPVCIHRVVPPQRGKPDATYKPRVSAPMFLRPRRGDGARLDVGRDLKLVDRTARSSSASDSDSDSDSACGEDALYFEEGLLDECDSMHLWSAHDVMKRR